MDEIAGMDALIRGCKTVHASPGPAWSHNPGQFVIQIDTIRDKLPTYICHRPNLSCHLVHPEDPAPFSARINHHPPFSPTTSPRSCRVNFSISCRKLLKDRQGAGVRRQVSISTWAVAVGSSKTAGWLTNFGWEGKENISRRRNGDSFGLVQVSC